MSVSAAGRGAGRTLVVAGVALAALGVGEAVEAACRPLPRVPFTIAIPGVWCLTRNFATSITTGTAVTINVDNVVLDLGGYTLDGNGAGLGTQATGIGSPGRSNLTVRNGTVRGFANGIQLTATPGTTRGNVVQGIRADRNTVVGIGAGGVGVLIRDNLVVETGGSTSASTFRAYGISAFLAPGGIVRDNEVVGTTNADPASFDYGIYAANSDDVVIERNRVRNPTASPAYSFGILVTFGDNIAVVDNRVSNVDTGLDYASSATGKYKDNLTSGAATPFSGTGTDAGGNN